MPDKKSDKILNRAKKKQKRIHAKADKAINKRGGGQSYEKVEFDSNTRTGKVVDTRTKKEQKVSERVNTRRKKQVEKVRTRLKPKYEKAKQKEQALGMNKQAYALKPVPEGNKGKGLSKLPTEVRNKMGYQMDSSHSFKGNVANNMKTMYMGSVYYQTDPPSEENGEIINTGESLQQKIGEDEQIKQVIKNKTVPGKVIGGGYENKMSNEAWEQYLANETPEQKEARIKREIADGVRQPNQVIQVKSEEKSKVPIFGEIKQEFDATGNFGRRQQMRGAIAQERKLKRANIKIAGLENRLSKAAPGSARAKKLQAKLNAQKNIAARGNEIARQTEMQEQQGIIGPNSIGSDGKVRKIKQDFTPSVVSGTGRNTKRYKLQRTKQQAQAQASGSKGLDKKGVKSAMSGFGFFMDLPPKAMKHFNRKNKK